MITSIYHLCVSLSSFPGSSGEAPAGVHSGNCGFNAVRDGLKTSDLVWKLLSKGVSRPLEVSWWAAIKAAVLLGALWLKPDELWVLWAHLDNGSAERGWRRFSLHQQKWTWPLVSELLYAVVISSFGQQHQMRVEMALGINTIERLLRFFFLQVKLGSGLL